MRKRSTSSGHGASHRQRMFTRLAMRAAGAAGKPPAFIGAALLVVVWAASGPLFHFGDTWQLVINTGTTIITFLMVFLIQNTQNRDTEAMQIKLDELIHVMRGANSALLDLEQLDDATLHRIRQTYLRKAAEARRELGKTAEETEAGEP